MTLVSKRDALQALGPTVVTNSHGEISGAQGDSGSLIGQTGLVTHVNGGSIRPKLGVRVGGSGALLGSARVSGVVCPRVRSRAPPQVGRSALLAPRLYSI